MISRLSPWQSCFERDRRSRGGDADRSLPGCQLAAITLQFALPGLMSLLALVDVSSQDVWRVSFATVAMVGAAALAGISRWGRVPTGMNLVVSGATLGAAVLYALIAVIAIHPLLVSDLGSLTPLRCEAILLSILVFLAVNLAWLLMFEDLPASA